MTSQIVELSNGLANDEAEPFGAGGVEIADSSTGSAESASLTAAFKAETEPPENLEPSPSDAVADKPAAYIDVHASLIEGLSKATNAQIRDACKKANLSTLGNKQQLLNTYSNFIHECGW